MARRRLRSPPRSAEYPRVIYGPYGASRTIQGPDEWVPGWQTSPVNDDLPPDATPRPPPYERGEIKRRLRAAGKAFPETAATSELYRILTAHG